MTTVYFSLNSELEETHFWSKTKAQLEPQCRLVQNNFEKVKERKRDDDNTKSNKRS